MAPIKTLAILALVCSVTWACSSNGDRIAVAGDICQICKDMIEEANQMEVYDAEEYLRHETKIAYEGEDRELCRQMINDYSYTRKMKMEKPGSSSTCSEFLLC